MDIFNHKKVEELEMKLAKAQREADDLRVRNFHLQTDLDSANQTLDEILHVKDSIPEDCVPGSYCAACEFSKKYYFDIKRYSSVANFKEGYLCNKGKSCKNFVQKEIKNND
jgi:hypothetical protein